MGYTIASITPRVAAKLNDASQSIFTDAFLLSFCKDAADELQSQLELNGILVLETISAAIIVPATTVQLSAPAGGGGSLIPSDMYEPQRIEERLSGSTDLFQLMTRREWEPDVLPTDSLRYWTYRGEDIFFVGATTDRDIKIYYLKHLLNVTSTSSTIGVNNSQQFMINRIAAMAARYVGENPLRADELDKVADENLNWVIRIGVKSKQGTRTRRRPYIVAGRRRWI